MATEILSINEMLSNDFEPKLQHRFILQVAGIDSFLIESATKPNMNFDEVPLPYLNNQRYVSGRMTPQPMNVVVREAIAPSATEKVMNWIRLNYEVETGRAGYSQMYKRTIFLKLIDGLGTVIEKWRLEGSWIQVANFGELTYENNNGLVKIQMTIRFDRAILEY